MHRQLKGCSRTLLATAFTLAGIALAPSTRAALPTLSPAVQAYVVHAQPVLAITHVRVIDGNGPRARENQTVLLREGRIAAVASHVKLPTGATVIDGSGQTLISGLVARRCTVRRYRIHRRQTDGCVPRHQGGRGAHGHVER